MHEDFINGVVSLISLSIFLNMYSELYSDELYRDHDPHENISAARYKYSDIT